MVLSLKKCIKTLQYRDWGNDNRDKARQAMEIKLVDMEDRKRTCLNVLSSSNVMFLIPGRHASGDFYC